MSSDISANTQEYQQEFFQDDYSYIHSAAETGSILGTEDFAQQGFQQFAQEDVVDENGVIVSSGTKPGKSLGEYQTNISGEQMVGSRYIAARSYTIESDEKEIRGKKSKISGVQTRWIDAIREDVMTKGYGVGNLPYYGYVNYALADKSTMVFSKNGEKVVLKPLINVSMEIQDPKIEAGKDNLLSFRIEDDMKYIGEHVKVFFKPDRWEDEEIEIDCIRGKCTLPFVYKTTGEFVADVRMESAISSWLAQIEVVSN
ncbi:MAG: hypothetical protein U9Q15_05060, partial [Patescibacteria group bacterium]|nr:hypothetical protein [Patescibacteria group bacterium]